MRNKPERPIRGAKDRQQRQIRDLIRREWTDRLPGGAADDREPGEFSPADVEDGAVHELEHTDDPHLAIEIAIDHLTEDRDYYRKLKTVITSGLRRQAAPIWVDSSVAESPEYRLAVMDVPLARLTVDVLAQELIDLVENVIGSQQYIWLVDAPGAAEIHAIDGDHGGPHTSLDRLGVDIELLPPPDRGIFPPKLAQKMAQRMLAVAKAKKKKSQKEEKPKDAGAAIASVSPDSIDKLRNGKGSVYVDEAGALSDDRTRPLRYLLVDRRFIYAEGMSVRSPQLRGAIRALLDLAPELVDRRIRTDGPTGPTAREFLATEATADLPPFLYHGTSDQHLDAILSTGLKPRRSTGVPPAHGWRTGAPDGNGSLIYLAADDARNATRFAARDAAARGGKPIVVKIDTRGLDTQRCVADEDSGAMTWQESLNRTGTLAYGGNISPEFLSVDERLEPGGWKAVTASAEDPHDPAAFDSISDVQALAPEMAAAAQTVYDAWQQDDEGVDEEYGAGGICDDIADALIDCLAGSGLRVEYQTSFDSAAHHRHCLVLAREGVFELDIPHRIYETGYGYRWNKIPNVRFDRHDISIAKVDRFDRWSQYEDAE